MMVRFGGAKFVFKTCKIKFSTIFWTEVQILFNDSTNLWGQQPSILASPERSHGLRPLKMMVGIGRSPWYFVGHHNGLPHEWLNDFPIRYGIYGIYGVYIWYICSMISGWWFGMREWSINHHIRFMSSSQPPATQPATLRLARTSKISWGRSFSTERTIWERLCLGDVGSRWVTLKWCSHNGLLFSWQPWCAVTSFRHVDHVLVPALATHLIIRKRIYGAKENHFISTT